MSQDENNQIANELKYEGLAALIITGQKEARLRHDDLKGYVEQRFNGVDSHNKRQNGSITKAMNDILELQKESDKRKLTCMAAVAVLQKRTKYTGVLKWINEHQRRSAILLFSLILGTQIIVLHAIQNGWLAKIWELIKEIK
jgi:hypothetical protein